jgi:hypothetical protein
MENSIHRLQVNRAHSWKKVIRLPSSQNPHFTDHAAQGVNMNDVRVSLMSTVDYDYTEQINFPFRYVLKCFLSLSTLTI